MGDAMPTYYAPERRATPERIAGQSRYFTEAWFFGELLHSLPLMVLILNEERQTVYANRAVLETVGAADLQSVLGQRPGEVFRCCHAGDPPGGCGTTIFCGYCGAANAILSSQAGRPAVEECRLLVRRGGGEEALDLRVWTKPINVNGERFTLCAMTNIADEKRRQFLEDIFLHDIMNTMTALRGFSFLAADDADPNARAAYLRQIASLTERSIEEIEAHKHLVEAEEGELKLNLKRASALTLLRQILDSYSRPEALNRRRVRLDDNCQDVEFETDTTLLRRVLGNMVKNAIEASVPGETVTLACRLEEGRVAFRVHNPTYMPENVRLQVFNRSFSTKAAGRGLGTYAMRFLTETYLGGTISFTSSEAEGTTFVARYPVKFAGRTAVVGS